MKQYNEQSHVTQRPRLALLTARLQLAQALGAERWLQDLESRWTQAARTACLEYHLAACAQHHRHSAIAPMRVCIHMEWDLTSRTESAPLLALHLHTSVPAPHPDMI